MSILLLLLIFINGFISIPTFSEKPSKTMRFNLIHRQAVEIFEDIIGPQKTRLDRVNELIEDDNKRTQMIYKRLGERRKVLGMPEAQMTLSSGAYTGTGQYFVPFRIGSPAQTFLLIADTGSDLTWVDCQYRCHNCRRSRRGHGRRARLRRRLFHADQSYSFKTIPCLTQMCKELPLSLVQCPTPMTPCAYDYSYEDQSRTYGFFANETVTVDLTNGRRMKLQQVPIGCSKSFKGSSFHAADGVLGLGFSKYSFATKAMDTFGGKFSYCLVDHLSLRNASNYLIFGANENIEVTNMQYTELVVGVIESFYAVKVLGISIAGEMLDIPMAVWDVNDKGGVILDSGTSLTVLAEPAYQLVMGTLKLAFKGFKTLDVAPFEFCFNTSGFDEAMVPKLAFHFVDAAQFEPPVKSYVIEVLDGVRCIGLVPGDSDGISIIGNILQQNFLWNFDLISEKLGYAPSTCT